MGQDQEKTILETLRFCSVCLWGFFGSFRMGGLLSTRKKTFDPYTHLLWKDMDFSGKDYIRVTVKTPKTARPGGELVILFKFLDSPMCPVTIFQE